MSNSESQASIKIVGIFHEVFQHEKKGFFYIPGDDPVKVGVGTKLELIPDNGPSFAIETTRDTYNSDAKRREVEFKIL